MNIYLVIFITLIAALVASFSQILYKKGLVNKITGVRSTIRAFKNKFVLIGLFGYLFSLVIYLFALSNAPLSIVYPTFASTFIFITLLSIVFLKEKASLSRIFGIFLVFLGIAIIAVSIG
ncbi:MAG: SMR family transporter [Candidatus Micrarchaeales archaeon]